MKRVVELCQFGYCIRSDDFAIGIKSVYEPTFTGRHLRVALYVQATCRHKRFRHVELNLESNVERVMPNHQPTSSDVARVAGVSRATVSVVLNGTQGNMRVSEATRQKVLTAVADLGYSPHPVAQALRRQQSRLIGFVPRSFRTRPFVQPIPYQLSIHIAQAATEVNYHVIEINAKNYASRSDDDLVRFLLSRRINGVVFDTPDTAQEVQRVIDSYHGGLAFPTIQLMRPQFAATTPTITIDARPGINAAIEHLITLGHRRVAFIGHSGMHPVDRVRRDYFVSALARHGISCPAEYLQLGPDYSIEEGYAFTRTLLALPDRPTAIFVASDSQALGALRALYEADVRVPEAISLISYDDTFAGHLYPPLTSVTQPIEEVAACAVSLLVERIDSPDGGAQCPEHMVLPTHLTIRCSTTTISKA